MFQWCMAHPWLTFFIICGVLMVISEAITMLENKHRLEYNKKVIDNKSDDK